MVLISSMGMGMVVSHDTGVPHSHGDEVTTEDTKNTGDKSSNSNKDSSKDSSSSGSSSGSGSGSSGTSSGSGSSEQ